MKWPIERRLIRAELCCDSFTQKCINAQKQEVPYPVDAGLVLEARAHMMVMREQLKAAHGWQWTLTSPNPPKTDEESRRRFGYLTQKLWYCPPPKTFPMNLEQFIYTLVES